MVKHVYAHLGPYFGTAYLGMCISTLALSIAELVIAKMYWGSDDQCDNNHLLSPVSWLQIDGIIGIIFSGISLLSFIDMGRVLPIMGCYGCFYFAWAVMGGIILWRDNTNCSPSELSNMMWASVLIHCIVAGSGTSFVVRGKNDNNNVKIVVYADVTRPQQQHQQQLPQCVTYTDPMERFQSHVFDTFPMPSMNSL